MIIDEKLQTFLEARTQLPNPDQYNSDTYTVSIGLFTPETPTDTHIYFACHNRTFTFKKHLSSLELATKYDWITTDMSLQQVVFENQIFAALLLHKVSVMS